MTSKEQAQLRVYVTTEHGSTEVIALKRHRRYPGRFLTMMVSNCEILSGWDRPPCYFRTLFHLLSVLDAQQYRRHSEREMAAATGMGTASISRAMAMLRADRVVMTEGAGVTRAIRLNHHIAWTSSAEKWNEVTGNNPDPTPEDARGR